MSIRLPHHLRSVVVQVHGQWFRAIDHTVCTEIPNRLSLVVPARAPSEEAGPRRTGRVNGIAALVGEKLSNNAETNGHTAVSGVGTITYCFARTIVTNAARAASISCAALCTPIADTV